LSVDWAPQSSQSMQLPLFEQQSGHSSQFEQVPPSSIERRSSQPEQV
jgi:hypothetical protein